MLRKWAGVILIYWVGTASAMAASATLAFDLPSQPLHDALQRYSEITGRSVLYDARQVSGLRAPALRGNYPADEALQRLIANSGLRAYFASDNAFMLKQDITSTADNADATSGTSRHWSPATRIFYGEIQSRITRALCALQQNLDTRIVIRFDIDASNKLTQLHVYAPESPTIERLVQQRLNGLTLVAPPDPANQTVILTIQPAQRAAWQRECLQ